MILVDTSIWIDHLRHSDPLLVELLNRTFVRLHPFVIGELALGNIVGRKMLLEYLRDLPSTKVASDDEVLFFIEQHGLHGQGIGYVDAHLLSAARLTPGTSLWTRDKRLLAVAERLSLDAKLTH